MLDDQQLLRRYAEEGSEAAFGEIVSRHVNLVYSTALRRMDGDAHRAQDAAQLVFTDLARKARSLPENTVLAGWLYRASRFAAAQLMRTERRRRAREETALAMNTVHSETTPGWEDIRPWLDEALDRLPARDRDALLLRFFEQRSLAEVGRALGAGEDAVRKRVERAVEKLRAHLSRRGVTTTAAMLSTAISAHAVQTAPAGLAATLAGASIAGIAASAGTSLTVLKMITLTKLQWSAGALIVAAATTTFVLQHQTQTRLLRENEALRQQVEQLAAAKPQDAAPPGGSAADAQNRADLMRLRAEVTLLREQTNEIALLQKNNDRLKEALSRSPRNLEENTAESETERRKQMGIAKMNDSRVLALSLLIYANDHGDQFPTNTDLLAPYLKENSLTGTNQFEQVYFGPMNHLKNPASTIVLRETQPWRVKAGEKWMKTYAFADGHSEVHPEADGNFEAWERERMVPSPAEGQ